MRLVILLQCTTNSTITTDSTLMLVLNRYYIPLCRHRCAIIRWYVGTRRLYRDTVSTVHSSRKVDNIDALDGSFWRYVLRASSDARRYLDNCSRTGKNNDEEVNGVPLEKKGRNCSFLSALTIACQHRSPKPRAASDPRIHDPRAIRQAELFAVAWFALPFVAFSMDIRR